ncbi:MAG TPA: prepilin-type N-terminal cleavage/methylation domain-containing protein [Thermodesulfobacteriota bacterium]|jgi:prepilin-type N-terminal cleavage/methylation domain-containing protein|nr:prepilin-type N-terminal cleavage/methylation domain-containing protein [Thermodesulfobacteriota bacterium]
MSGIKKESGFTLLEILVAVFIMSLGFLAAAEMQFLSLRQKQLAEQGTVATNLVQYVSDRDMAEVRRRYLLNATAYIDAQAGRTLNLSYCNGSGSSICDGCPCDPLEALTPNPTCAVVDANDFNPMRVNFRTTEAECKADGAAILEANGSPLYIVRRAETTEATLNGVQTLTVLVTYAVKTPPQFNKTGLGSVSIRDSLVSQAYGVTANIGDFSNFIADWDKVNIPHIP